LAGSLVIVVTRVPTMHTVTQTVTQTSTAEETVNRTSTVSQTETQTVTATPSTLTTTMTQAEPCFGQLVWKADSETSSEIPVLLMRPDSTAYICVTYQTAWKGIAANYSAMFDATPNATVWKVSPPGMVVAKWDCTSNGCLNTFYSNSSSICGSIPGGCYHSFVISGSPGSVNVTISTDYVNFLYTITALSNSTGFYDESAPYDYCEGMPLAVGYTASQVNASDFTIKASLCPFEYLQPSAVSVIGINFTTIG